MNESQLTEVFGSADRFRTLRALFGEPGRGFGLRELAAQAGVDSSNVSRMLKRWVAAGLVTRRQTDGLPRYVASTDPSLRPLVQLMQQDSALVRTLREPLLALPGIKVAVVFGSVARGEAQAGSDVDVLVLPGHGDHLVVPGDGDLPLIDEILAETGLSGGDIDDLMWGCAQQRTEQDNNVARVIALLSELGENVPATTINRWCASSMQAVISASDARYSTGRTSPASSRSCA